MKRPHDSYVSKKHFIDAKQHHNDSTFIPKWKRAEEDVKGCIHLQCQDRFNEKLLKPAFATICALKFGVQVADNFPFLLYPPCCSKDSHQFNPQISFRLVRLHQS